MYILLVFFILTLLVSITILNLNVKLFVKIESNALISYIKIYFINIPLFKFNIKHLKRRKKDKRKSGVLSEYLIIKDIIKKGFIKLERFKLKADISVADPIVTAFSVMLISTAIPILIKYYNIKVNYNGYKYTIKPIYADEIILNIQLDSIIKTNLVNIMYIFYKKWRRDINGRKASNRKPYDDCHEQHKRND